MFSRAHIAIAAMAATLLGSQMSDLPDPALMRRWAALHASILGEFAKDSTSPVANLQGDFSSLELRVRIATDRPWVDRKLTEPELRRVNIDSLARSLYAEAKKR